MLKRISILGLLLAIPLLLAQTAVVVQKPFVTATANYTGRVFTTGTGTDARAVIQSFLTASADVDVTGSYYDYLNRRSRPVVLAPGNYYFGPVEGGPVLAVPAGVTFDFSAANLFVAYPTTPTNDWCAIQLAHGAKVIVGRIYAIGDTTGAPGYAAGTDYRCTYDAIRVKESDAHAWVLGRNGESEIRGFRGAGVRVIASWNAHVDGLLITGTALGVVTSKFGDAFSSVGRARTSSAGNNTCTATWITDTQFSNIGLAAVVAGAAGSAASPNGVAYDAHNDGLYLDRVSFENVGGRILQASGAIVVRMSNYRIEECGASSDVILLDTCKTPRLTGGHFFLTGRTFTRITETAANNAAYQPFPARFIDAPNDGDLRIDGLYTNNTFRSGMDLVDERGTTPGTTATVTQSVVEAGSHPYN